MLGYLDGVADGEVFGWALDPENLDRPTTVNILVNGSPVAETLAFHHRSDVAELANSAGFHGYYVDLRKHCPSNERAIIEVVTDNGTVLTDSPACAEIPALPESSQPIVLFMHIPKTAGTALREAIEPNYRRSEVAHLYPDSTYFPGGSKLWSLPLAQRSGLRFIAGHFQFGIHNALPGPSEYVTVLRNPLQRIVSQYHYYCRFRPELVSDSDRILSFEEVLEKHPNSIFDNLMVRFFSGVKERNCLPGSVDRPIFEIALQNLRTQFAYVGFQENAATAFAAMQQKYGWFQCPELPSLNVGDWHLTTEETAEARIAVEHFERWDMLLYREALKLYA